MEKLARCFLLCFGAVALAACSDDEPQVGAHYTMRIKAANPATSESRTALDQNGLTPLWTVDEKLGVTFGEGTFQLTGDHTAPVAETVFAGAVTVPAGADKFYAFHPADAAVNGTNVTFSIPMTQAGGNNFPDDILISEAAPMSLDGSPVALRLKRQSALIHIKMILKDVTMLDPKKTQLVYAAFSNNGEFAHFTGQASLDLKQGQLVVDRSKSFRNAMVDFQGESLEEQNSFYLNCFPTTFPAGSELVFGWATNGYEIKKTVILQNPIEVRAGHIVQFNITITDQEIH